MKLMTLNSHSLAEADYERKLHLCADGIRQLEPDILAMQEVNQTRNAPEADVQQLKDSGFLRCPALPGEVIPPVRRDNHAFRMAVLAAEAGRPFFWTWVPAKVGYDRYDEGLALFSRFPIKEIRQFYLTRSKDYQNWTTRKALGIAVETEAGRQHAYSLHMGWWNDMDEPFLSQWERLEEETKELKQKGETVWLMGDFNAPAGISGESWEKIRSCGWTDTYDSAEQKDEGITVGGIIDGWRETADPHPAMRIDYIWCSRPYPVLRSMAVFNGKGCFGYPAFSPVSDHFGVMAECGIPKE